MNELNYNEIYEEINKTNNNLYQTLIVLHTINEIEIEEFPKEERNAIFKAVSEMNLYHTGNMEKAAKVILFALVQFRTEIRNNILKVYDYNGYVNYQMLLDIYDKEGRN